MPNELDWATLIQQIREGECAPILGAGTSFGVPPLGAELAGILLQMEETRTNIRSPIAERDVLAKVSQYLAVRRKDNVWPKKRIADYLKSQVRPDVSLRETYQVLAQLGLPIYLTTNYDDFTVAALRTVRADVHQEFTRWTSPLLEDHPSVFDSGFLPDHDHPVVFHLYGHWDITKSLGSRSNKSL